MRDRDGTVQPLILSHQFIPLIVSDNYQFQPLVTTSSLPIKMYSFAILIKTKQNGCLRTQVEDRLWCSLWTQLRKAGGRVSGTALGWLLHREQLQLLFR